MEWTPLGNNEFTFKDDDVIAFFTTTTTTKTVKDSNLPTRHEVADPEMTADGIPELIERYDKLNEEYDQWEKQGWWPKEVKVDARHLTVHHREAKITFTATLDADTGLDVASNAVHKIKARRQPAFMEKHEG